MKTIKISGKNYDMKSSAYTQFAYKNKTGRSLLNDLQSLNGVDATKQVEDLVDILLNVSYVMIEEANKDQVKNYEEFVKGIDDLFSDSTWINEVVELAIMPLSGGNIQKS